jgi:hypothetical protein
MVVNCTLAPHTCTPGSVPAVFPSPIGGGAVTNPTSQVSFVNGTAGAIPFTRYTYEYVDIQGTVLAPNATLDSRGEQIRNFTRYAEYPAEALFKRTYFEVNGNPLDDYTNDVAVFRRKYFLKPGKVIGYSRLVGQEVPIDGYSDLLSIANRSIFPANNQIQGTTGNGLNNAAGSLAAGAPVPATQTARKKTQIVNGPQTPKVTQPALDLWNPLHFWFNLDPRLAIASVSIPYGQRFIKVDLANQNEVVFVAPGNLFLRLTVERVVNSTGTDVGVAIQSYDKYVTLTPVLAAGSTLDSAQQITNFTLYINNIFMNPEIHDIYIKRIGFSLIRVHRMQKQNISDSSNSVLLSQLKWPTEALFVGFQPVQNVANSNINKYRDWHRYSLMTDNTASTLTRVNTKSVVTGSNIDAAAQVVSNYVTPNETISYAVSTPTVSTIKVRAQSIDLFNDFKSAFFSSYMPYTFGAENVMTPEDEGSLLINFCLNLGTYQPSGHINISRTREFYIEWLSQYFGSGITGFLIAVARAINFLLISDGSALIRYAT